MSTYSGEDKTPSTHNHFSHLSCSGIFHRKGFFFLVSTFIVFFLSFLFGAVLSTLRDLFRSYTHLRSFVLYYHLVLST